MIHHPKTMAPRSYAKAGNAGRAQTITSIPGAASAAFSDHRPPETGHTALEDAPPVTGGTPRVNIDAGAIESAVGSLYDTLRRCEDERVRLQRLMKDAQSVQSGTAAPSPAQQATALTAAQIAQVPALDAWISRRLAELHQADDALASRQEKLEKLQASLGKIAAGLAEQIQQFTQAKAEMTGQHDSISDRLANAARQLEEQAQAVELGVAQHVARVQTAETDLSARIARIEKAGKATLIDIEKKFETLATGIVGRLEAVRKPVEKWLHQHLEQYEALLNERIESAHIPMADRIATIEHEVAQALAPIEANVDQRLVEITRHVQDTGEKIMDALDQQFVELQENVDQRVLALDDKVTQAIVPSQAAAEEGEKRILEQLQGLPGKVEDELTRQAQDTQARLVNYMQVAQQEMQHTLDPMSYHITGKVEVLRKQVLDLGKEIEETTAAMLASNKDVVDEHLHQARQEMAEQQSRLMADIQKQVDQMVALAQSRVQAETENLGGRTTEFDQWFAQRRKDILAQLDDMEAQARAAAENAEAIMHRRVDQTRKQLPVTIENLVSQAQESLVDKTQAFKAVIENAFTAAQSQTQTRIATIESETLQQLTTMDQRLRQRIAAVHSDTRSMLDVIEKQLARKVESFQSAAREKLGGPSQDSTAA